MFRRIPKQSMTILCPTRRASFTNPSERYILSENESFSLCRAVPSTISNVHRTFRTSLDETPYQVSILAFLATSVGIGRCCLGLFSSRCFNPLLDGSTRDWPVKRIIPGKKIWMWRVFVSLKVVSCCSAFFKWFLFDSMIIVIFNRSDRNILLVSQEKGKIEMQKLKKMNNTFLFRFQIENWENFLQLIINYFIFEIES